MYDWAFDFSHPDFEYLQSKMEPIADFFAEVLSLTPDQVIGSFNDAPTAEDENGNVFQLDPTMTLEYHGLITEDVLSRLHKGFKKLAIGPGRAVRPCPSFVGHREESSHRTGRHVLGTLNSVLFILIVPRPASRVGSESPTTIQSTCVS